MCAVSAVGDFYSDRWKWVPQTPVYYPNTTTAYIPPQIAREEFEALKVEVAEMKELLIAAKRIDEVTGQPDCEMAEKVATLRRIAELVGIDLEDVLKT